jgi:hypothetical protein
VLRAIDVDRSIAPAIEQVSVEMSATNGSASVWQTRVITRSMIVQ